MPAQRAPPYRGHHRQPRLALVQRAQQACAACVILAVKHAGGDALLNRLGVVRVGELGPRPRAHPRRCLRRQHAGLHHRGTSRGWRVAAEGRATVLLR